MIMWMNQINHKDNKVKDKVNKINLKNYKQFSNMQNNQILGNQYFLNRIKNRINSYWENNFNI